MVVVHLYPSTPPTYLLMIILTVIVFDPYFSPPGIALGDALQDNKVLKTLNVASNSIDSVACLTICAGVLENEVHLFLLFCIFATLCVLLLLLYCPTLRQRLLCIHLLSSSTYRMLFLLVFVS